MERRWGSVSECVELPTPKSWFQHPDNEMKNKGPGICPVIFVADRGFHKSAISATHSYEGNIWKSVENQNVKMIHRLYILKTGLIVTPKISGNIIFWN